MRKLVPILVISILVFSGLGAVAFSQDQKVSEQNEIIVFSNPVLNQVDDFTTVEISEATTNTMESGKPMLPKYTKTYIYPFGTEIEDVKVTFSEPLVKEVNTLIQPAPEKLILSSVTIPKVTKETVEEEYSKIDIYPKQKFSYYAGAGLDNGERVIFLTVSIFPVQYVPSENLIYYSNSAKIDTKVRVPITPINFGDSYDMLIISPAEFSSALQPLIDYKNDHDTKTILTTLDEIPSTGVDQQESIKYYIKDSIETWGITYLLLVGNADKFPVRYAYIPSGSYEDSHPSDLYYADIYNAEMGFSSWDADGDGKYCEVTGSSNDMAEVDMYPDVYLGKLPAASTIELSSFVEKLLYYEEHNKMLNTILQIGGDTFPGDEEEVNEGEFANGEVMKNLPGYEYTRCWASSGTLKKQSIADGFNKGVDFADFSGHGSPQSWATHAPQDDEVWLPPATVRSFYSGFLYVDFDLYVVQNKEKLPVVVYNACSTSKYTAADPCLSWKTVMKPNGGGIACFGASGIGYGSYGTHETERVWGWMEVHIFKEIFNNKDLGLSWANCLNGYINSFYSDGEWDDGDYKTITEMAMFGDPSLIIEDGPDPKSRSISLEQEFSPILERLMAKFPILEKILRLVL